MKDSVGSRGLAENGIVLKKNKAGRALRPLKPTGMKTSGKRLVLGFDGWCFSCGELAWRIEEQLEGSLEVRNLATSTIRVPRSGTGRLRERKPRGLTLFEVRGWRRCGRGPAGTGIALSRFLGSLATWGIM